MSTLTANEKNFWIEIAEELLKFNFFERNYDNEDFENFLDINDMCWTSGCTKYAFISNNSNWVLKTEYGSNKRNYCAAEQDYYILAEECGLQNFFAETRYLITINDRDFYVQRRAEVNEDRTSDFFYEYCSPCYSDSYFEDEDEKNEAIWDSVYDMCDEDRIRAVFDDEKLLSFLEENHINDIHEGNIGYSNGFPILIDFSGY